MKKLMIILVVTIVMFNISVTISAQEAYLKFLTLPFNKQDAVIMSGWYYSPNSFHGGIDYNLTYEDVVAAASGTVETILDNQPNTYPNDYNWGNYVRIDHGNGFKTIYAHLKTGEINVEEGESVSRGQIIATSGNTGYSSGPHLHFEVWGPSTGGVLSNGAYKYDPYGIYSVSGDLAPYINNQMDDTKRLWSTNPPSYSLPYSSVGCFSENDCNGPISQAFQQKYSDMADDGHPLGNPWQNPAGWTAYVHDLNGMWIQDFEDLRDEGGPSNGYYNPYSSLIYYDDPWINRGAKLLKEGFWDVWMRQVVDGTPGWEVLGVPVTDEYSQNGYIYQRFYKFGDNYLNNPSDYLVFYLRWDPVGKTLIVEDGNHQELSWASLVASLTSTPSIATKSTDNFPVLTETNQRNIAVKKGAIGGGGEQAALDLKMTNKLTTVSSSSSDGLYHSGVLVANFGQPVNMLDGYSYDDFYAVVNGSVTPIDPFTMNGDMTIYVDGSSSGPNIQFSHWTIYPNPGTVGQQIHVEGQINNNGSASVTLSEVRIEFIDPNGNEVYHWSEYNVILGPDYYWYQWLYCYPYMSGNHTARFRGLVNGTWETYATQTVYIQSASNYPVANFSVTPDYGVLPLVVQFTDQSTGNPTVWNWNFGDGTTSSEQSPSHTYSSPGSYTVSLTVSNSSGSDTEIKSNWIQVFQPVVSNFSYSFGEGPDANIAPATVNFLDESLYNPTSWHWNFGDGTTSSEQSPSHVYNEAGDYNVTLTVSNSVSSDSFTDNVYIDANLSADFIANTTTAYAPVVIHFTDQSTGNPTSWYWDFGNNVHSTVQNPSPTYYAPGVYSVKLVVENSGEIDSVLMVDYINIVGATYPVDAAFSADTTFGSAPLTVQFTDQSSGYPDTWYWDFGDSTTSSEQNPIHTYLNNGMYTVSLTVSNASNTDSTFSIGYIMVGDIPECIVGLTQTTGYAIDVTVSGNYAYVADTWAGLQIIDISNPQTPTVVGEIDLSTSYDVAVSGNYAYVADYTSDLRVIDISNPSSPVAVKKLSLSGVSRGLCLSNNYVYLAEGDGMQIIDVSNPTNPQWVSSISSPGYSIEVGVLGEYAYLMDQSSGIQIVDISNPLSPEIVHTVNTPGAAEDIVFADSLAYVADHNSGLCILDISNPSSAHVISSISTSGRVEDLAIIGDIVYLADFSNDIQIVDVSDPTGPMLVGNIEVEGQTQGIFVEGDYLYIAAMTGGLAVADLACGYLSSNFTVSKRSGYSPLTVHFTDQSTGNPISWYWDFGDGTTSSEQNPQHVYSGSGGRTVSLTVSDGSITKTKTIDNFITVRVKNFKDDPKIELADNYPNPFNPSTTISYSLPTSQHVSLVVYNILGQTVTTLVDGMKEAGEHSAIWDGRNDSGSPVGSGMYFYRLTTTESSIVRKMILLK